MHPCCAHSAWHCAAEELLHEHIPAQAARANALAKEQGLGDKASFQVADALQQPFEDGAFDLVWSMESGEHMPDKARFVGELARVCMPGGRIIIVTWCHRRVTHPS